MTTRNALIILLLLALFPFPACPAAEENHAEAIETPADGVASLFAVAARPPHVGEWVEYRIAFPVDPLENSLRSDPAPQPLTGMTPQNAVEVDGQFYIKPSFEPPEAWRVLPLRMEVRAVDSLGCEVMIRFEKERHLFHLPIDNGQPKAEFFFDPPQEEEHRRTIALGDDEHEATVTVRRGERYGFIRWSGTDVPFGIYRFATEHVDLILVGMGTGTPPPFPLEPASPITPPPGHLYVRDTRREQTLDDDSF